MSPSSQGGARRPPNSNIQNLGGLKHSTRLGSAR